MIGDRSTFFIVGAPRCGTTAISKALADHPQICFAKPKETYYFVQELGKSDRQFSHEKFIERYFPHRTEAHTLLGEGSVSALYSEDAISRILDFDPDAKLIVIVRNPVDMVYSYHGRMLFLLDEDEQDFRRAWSLQDERAAGRALPRRCRDPRLLRYRDVAMFSSHIERLFERVGKERCAVIVFEDFIEDPASVYRCLCDFLQVADDGRTKFKARNDHRQFRNRFLQQFLFNPPPLAMKAFEKMNVAPAELLMYTRPLRRWIKRKNTVRARRPPLEPDMRAELKDHFAPEVERMKRLLGRDLSHWDRVD